MQKTSTFNPESFEHLKRAEANHFWFEVRRRWIFDKIKKYKNPPADLVEIGCGTGNVSSYLASKGYNVTGCEYFNDAIDLAWPGFKIVQGDANHLPFDNESFDIVGLFDVIEHFEDDIAIVKEAKRVLKKGGIMAITVPARDELWSIYDIKSSHKRRYTMEKLANTLHRSELNILLMEYMFMALYMPMRYIRKRDLDDPFRINKLVNNFLKCYFDVERKLSNFFSLPIGTSLIAISRREGIL